jgi:hypothetical protein
MTDDRCPHFHIEIREQPAGLQQPLRVPVYHCKVATALVTRLNTLPDGTVLTERDETSPIAGPDGFPITVVACTVTRYYNDCAPAGDQTLQQVGLGPLRDLRTFPHLRDNIADCAPVNNLRMRSIRLKATLQRARSLCTLDMAARTGRVTAESRGRSAMLMERSAHLMETTLGLIPARANA